MQFDKHLYNISLASKTVAVHEAVTTNDLDVLVLTETWHCTSDDICLSEAAPSDFTVVDSVRESQPGYGGIAVLYSALLQCTRVEVPQVKTFEAQWRINHDANDAMAWGPPLKGAPRAAV